MPADMSKEIANETGEFLRELVESESVAAEKAIELADLVVVMEMCMKLLGTNPPHSVLEEVKRKTNELREILPVEFQDREHLLVNLEAIMAEQIAKRS